MKKRIPGTLDTARHSEFIRPAHSFTSEPYLEGADKAKVERLIESGALTVFRLNKCAGPLCDGLVPKDSHKTFCSKQCWENKQNLVEGSGG